MAKMGSGSGLRKIALSQIVDTGNVRFDYRDIEELAESIRKNGQLAPALVKALEADADGLEKFELVAGHRRFRALQFLFEKEKGGFTTIDAIVVTGEKLTLQLVENLQRSDLTAAERERGIFQMCQKGVSQKEIAARLSKSAEYVSRNVAAYKIREAASAAGVDTSGLATGTLNEIQAADAADYPALVNEIKQGGGTLEAARVVMENYRVAHGKPAKPKAKPQAPAAPEGAGGISDPLSLHPSPSLDPLEERFSGEGDDIDAGVNESDPPVDAEARADMPPEKPAAKPEKARSAPARSWIEDFEPPEHKEVDFNSVCVAVFNYAKDQCVEKCPVYLDNKSCAECEVTHFCGAYYKQEAARDVIALLEVAL
jgi:ParB/RepB/Spo0J family partition protein